MVTLLCGNPSPLLMTFESALSRDRAGTVLRVHVIPHARDYTMEYDEWRKELKVRVKAEPKQGRANQDLITFLSHSFKNPVIIAGIQSRSKKVRVENPLEETIRILGEVL